MEPYSPKRDPGAVVAPEVGNASAHVDLQPCRILIARVLCHQPSPLPRPHVTPIQHAVKMLQSYKSWMKTLSSAVVLCTFIVHTSGTISREEQRNAQQLWAVLSQYLFTVFPSLNLHPLVPSFLPFQKKVGFRQFDFLVFWCQPNEFLLTSLSCHQEGLSTIFIHGKKVLSHPSDPRARTIRKALITQDLQLCGICFSSLRAELRGWASSFLPFFFFFFFFFFPFNLSCHFQSEVWFFMPCP